VNQQVRDASVRCEPADSVEGKGQTTGIVSTSDCMCSRGKYRHAWSRNVTSDK